MRQIKKPGGHKALRKWKQKARKGQLQVPKQERRFLRSRECREDLCVRQRETLYEMDRNVLLRSQSTAHAIFSREWLKTAQGEANNESLERNVVHSRASCLVRTRRRLNTIFNTSFNLSQFFSTLHLSFYFLAVTTQYDRIHGQGSCLYVWPHKVPPQVI